MKRFATVASIMLVLLAGPALSQPTNQLQSSAEVRRQLGAAIERGDRKAVTENALRLAQMEATLSDASFARIESLLDPARIKAARIPFIRNSSEQPVVALRDLFRSNGDTSRFDEDAPVVANVPAEYRLVEGIARDDRTGRLFIGTVVDGRLAYEDDKNQWHEVPLGNPRASLFGMAVDDPRRLLWIATGSVEQTAIKGLRMAGLIAVNLDTLQVARRVPLAEGKPGAPGDLTIASDGTVYVSNAVSGAVHRCPPGCIELEDWLPAGSWRSPQGLALADRDRLLYLADYSTGIWIIDTRTRQFRQAKTLQPTMLEGIDGLRITDDGNLIAIQNGTSPRRILTLYRTRDRPLGPTSDRYVLASTRTTVAADQGEPTLGTFVGAFMLFVGDAQWERFGPGGRLKDSEPLRPTPIRMIGAVDIYSVPNIRRIGR